MFLSFSLSKINKHILLGGLKNKIISIVNYFWVIEQLLDKCQPLSYIITIVTIELPKATQLIGGGVQVSI